MPSKPPSPRSDRPDPAVIALVGGTGLIGREVRDRLSAGRLAAAELRLYEAEGREGTLIDLGGEAAIAAAVEDDSFSTADLLILCCGPGAGDRILGFPRKPGAAVIDLSGSRAGAGAPVVAIGVNDAALERHSGVIQAPGPAALLVATLLHGARAAGEAEAAEAIVFEPASGLGEQAMDELWQQAVNVFKFSDPPRGTFGRQLAFNLLPLSLAGGLDGVGRERAAAEQVRRVLGWEAGRLALRTLLAPVFHCHSALLRVTFRPAVSAAALHEALSGAEAFHVGAPDGSLEAADTPVEWAGRERIRIAEVREDGRGALWVWAIVDDLKGGAAENVARIAEALIPR